MQLYIAGNTMPPTTAAQSVENANGLSPPKRCTAVKNSSIKNAQRSTVTVWTVPKNVHSL